MYTEINNFSRCRVSDRGACRNGAPAPEPRREMQENGSCNHNDGCGNGVAWGLVGYPLASVYAPLQEFKELYDEERALKSGTLFSQLDLPFMSGKNGKGGCGCD